MKNVHLIKHFENSEFFLHHANGTLKYLFIIYRSKCLFLKWVLSKQQNLFSKIVANNLILLY